MTLREQLTRITAAAFAACGYEEKYGDVTVSDRPDLCEFQCNGAMAAAKQHKRPPFAIAEEIVAKLSGEGVFDSVEVVRPGFINMKVSASALAATVSAMASDARMGLPLMERKKIVFDYGGPNIAKPLHVGHLRVAIIGNCMYRLAKFLGHEAISDVHMGDWGLQMGLVIAGIEERWPELPYFDPGFSGEYPASAPFSAEDLNEIYPAASAKSKEDKAFAERAARVTVLMQNGDRAYRALCEQIRAVSVADMKKNYARLGVDFDMWLGESDSAPYVPQLIEILEERGLLVESEGAKVVFVGREGDKEPMPPVIIEKSNGGDVYATTDLSTILQRVTDWAPDEIWYFVDSRQTLHLKQVFRAAALAGIIRDEAQCVHAPNGTMNGKDGRPYKTREGGVMRLSDLLDSAVESAYEKTAASDAFESDAGKRETAEKIGIAAVKIGDLINHRTKDYIFDLERFLSSEGKTGPYLQYTAVRINSVLSKARENGERLGPVLPPAQETERGLMLALAGTGDALRRAFAEKAPNVLCDKLFEIAGLFNKFYYENRILTCPDDDRRASWLALLGLTVRMLEALLYLVGVDVPEKM